MTTPKNQLAHRIRLAREAARLTQAELASELGLPRSAIVQIEAGRRNVSGLELERIAFLCGRELQDFLQPTFGEEEALGVLFRATAPSPEGTIPPRLRQCVALARERQKLERLAGIERSRRAAAIYAMEPPQNRWEAITQGDRVANEERQRLGLGRVPVPDIAQLIESQGVQTAQVEFEDDVSGLTLTGNAFPTIVAVNLTHHQNRKRFSFAHEYAHVLLDRDTHGRISRATERDDLREVRANAFAAAFLLPESGVREAVEEMGKGRPSRLSATIFDESDEPEVLIAESRSEPGSQDIQLYDVVQLAERFDVSPLAMIYRLRNLKLVSEPELERLRSADDLQRMHLLQMLLEMRDPPKATEPPNPRFVGLALEVFRRDKITRAKLIELLRLADLPGETLDQLIATAGVDDDTPHGV